MTNTAQSCFVNKRVTAASSKFQHRIFPYELQGINKLVLSDTFQLNNMRKLLLATLAALSAQVIFTYGMFYTFVVNQSCF